MAIGNMTRRAALLGCAAVGTFGMVTDAAAQTFPVKLGGFSGGVLKTGPVGIPAYQLTFITAQQGTASGGVLTKSRLTTSLANVPEATMRKLADEAYADLKAQLSAAAVDLIPEAETRAAVAATGVETPPGNAEITRIAASITIGAGVKRAYAAFGAAGAPMIKGLHNPNSPTGFSPMGMISMNNKLGEVAKARKGILLMPSLIIDFGQTSASAGRDFLGREAASVSNKLGFGLTMGTQTAVLASANGRAVTPQWMRMAKDVSTATPFATVATGEGAVRALSIASVTNSMYVEQDAARGDAVVVDLPVWEGLVRQAFRDYNAAIAAEFRKARG